MVLVGVLHGGSRVKLLRRQRPLPLWRLRLLPHLHRPLLVMRSIGRRVVIRLGQRLPYGHLLLPVRLHRPWSGVPSFRHPCCCKRPWGVAQPRRTGLVRLSERLSKQNDSRCRWTKKWLRGEAAGPRADGGFGMRGACLGPQCPINASDCPQRSSSPRPSLPMATPRPPVHWPRGPPPLPFSAALSQPAPWLSCRPMLPEPQVVASFN